MDIREAKQTLIDTVRAYLARDEYGSWAVPVVAQRPILLMGPPGVGKTAIAQQAAQACGVALVSYTITHHTRQSAIGLPRIRTAQWQDRTFSVTEYTMSEIIASVYQAMEDTGLSQGILFLDEVNCVSETLAPAMLQFLQCKTFGSHHLPEGWVIVAAGNPPEYNRSVRDFDIVTLDRVRRVDIQAAYQPWKEYAYLRQVHPAVLAYLELKPQYFYRLETTVDGKRFATARGWEDLSRLISAYEQLSLPVNQALVEQYIQHPVIARDFASYYDLYQRYRSDYDVEAILSGHLSETTLNRLRLAPFDERLSALSLLLDGLFRSCREANQEDAYVSALHQRLKSILPRVDQGEAPRPLLEEAAAALDRLREEKARARLLSPEEGRLLDRLTGALTALTQAPDSETIRARFRQAAEARQQAIDVASLRLDRAFGLLESAFGEGQELVIFLTELTMNPFSMQYLTDNGHDAYTQYHRRLLLGGARDALLEELNGL